MSFLQNVTLSEEEQIKLKSEIETPISELLHWQGSYWASFIFYKDRISHLYQEIEKLSANQSLASSSCAIESVKPSLN